MSPIGRIFVVVNLALAAAFLGFASSTLANSHKYRGLYDASTVELEKTRTELQAEVESLTAARDEARRERAQTLEQKNNLENNIKGLNATIASLTEEKATLTERIGSIDKTLGDYNTTNSRLAQEAKAANDERLAAVNARRDAEQAREAALQAQRDAEERLAQTERDMAQTERDLQTAREELEKRNTLIEAYAQTTGLSSTEIGGELPTIEASVLGVIRDDDQVLVHLNQGSDAGVKRGYPFLIYSGGQLKGRARVEVVNATTSTAIVTEPVEGRTIGQGDRATTRL